MLEFISLLAVTALSYHIWRKEKNRIYLYYLWLYAAGMLMIAWEYFAKDILRLSGEANLINKDFILIFWIAVGLVWIFLTIKDLKGNGKKKGRE